MAEGDGNSNIEGRVAMAMAADHGILDTFGMQVTYAREGECRIKCVVPRALVNAAGFAHGGVSFVLLDTACAYALGSLETRGVTLNANVTYVRGAGAADELNAVVRLQSRTRRMATLRGEVLLGRQDVLAAHGSFVFQLLDPSKTS